MIPAFHRAKGGAAQLGVTPGLPGPLGTYEEERVCSCGTRSTAEPITVGWAVRRLTALR